MGEACYPDSLVERLCEAWKPPHRKPLGGEPSGVAFPEAVVREVVDHVFFASLRAEEGRYLRQGVVLVPDVDELRQVHPRWDLMVLESKVDFSAAALAKLAPALAPECYAIVASAPDRLRIVGLGKPHDGHWLVAEDRYPRVRCLGPGDLVFLRGGSALLRYRAGEVSTPEGDYFQAAGEPATTMAEMTDRLFEHRDGAVDQQDRDAVRWGLAEIMDAVAAAGHGALLAILAGDDPDLVPLLDACDYRIAPIDVGDALVDEYESGLVMAQVEQEMMGPGPDYLPFRAPTKEELRSEAAWKETQAGWRAVKEFAAGAASVDGAVLLTSNLRIMGFGCKLPRSPGAPPTVTTPGPDGTWTRFDLTKRGTRHAAAAQFAIRPGRLALIVSADGPAGCFSWSAVQGEVVYRPVYLGPFAPNRW